jgi:hypothetical protein
MLEPRSHLALAITYKMLALFRNLVKYREMNTYYAKPKLAWGNLKQPTT